MDFFECHYLVRCTRSTLDNGEGRHDTQLRQLTLNTLAYVPSPWVKMSWMIRVSKVSWPSFSSCENVSGMMIVKAKGLPEYSSWGKQKRHRGYSSEAKELIVVCGRGWRESCGTANDYLLWALQSARLPASIKYYVIIETSQHLYTLTFHLEVRTYHENILDLVFSQKKIWIPFR